MPVPLKIVASHVMDEHLRAFKTQTDFFDLSDYIYFCAIAAANFYQQQFDRERQENRADKIDQVVNFDDGYLSSQIIKAKRINDDPITTWEAQLLFDVMTFAWDSSNSGIQGIFVIDPKSDIELERSSVDSTWNYKYLPTNNRIFWRLDKMKIKFFTKGKCNVNEVRLLYVPDVDINNPDVEIPDGLIEPITTSVVAKMKQLADTKLVKKTLDGNENTVPQSELNLQAVKP